MKSKLSPLEELRMERAKLLEECALGKEKLKGNLSYAKGNFGHLLFNSVVSSTKNGMSDVLSIFSGSGKSSKSSKSSSGAGSLLLSMAPVVWEIVQPMLIGLLVKKAKSAFTKKKKKKKASED